MGSNGQIKLRNWLVATGTTENAVNVTNINASAWYFIAISVILNADAITSTVTAKLDGNADSVDSLANWFIDNAAPVTYKKFVGTKRGDAPSAGRFGGFIYGIWIENVA